MLHVSLHKSFDCLRKTIIPSTNNQVHSSFIIKLVIIIHKFLQIDCVLTYSIHSVQTIKNSENISNKAVLPFKVKYINAIVSIEPNLGRTFQTRSNVISASPPKPETVFKRLLEGATPWLRLGVSIPELPQLDTPHYTHHLLHQCHTHKHCQEDTVACTWCRQTVSGEDSNISHICSQ